LVYSYGSVGGRGGGYRILDSENGDVLKDYMRAQSATNATTYIEIPDTPSGTNKVWTFGTYIRFKGLVSPNIKIQGTTVSLGDTTPARPAVRSAHPSTLCNWCPPPAPSSRSSSLSPQ
jgi:hypothetical protein